MKSIEKIFPALAFMAAIACALQTTKADVNPPPVVTVSIFNPGATPTCLVVGTCEQIGTSICTDVYGNQLHRYTSQSGTCFPYVLGIFIESDE
jgi:hypothetical protein